MSAEITEADVREYLRMNGGSESVPAVLGALAREWNVPPSEENAAVVAAVLDDDTPEIAEPADNSADDETATDGGVASDEAEAEAEAEIGAPAPSEPDTPPEGMLQERHYGRDDLIPVLRALGAVGDGYEMVGKRGTYGWYRETTPYTDLTPGETAEARVYGLGTDAPRFLHRAATEPMGDRSIYGTTTAVSSEWLADSWAEFTRTVGGKTWFTDDGEGPMPPYEQVEQFGLFVDMDLENAAKAARYGKDEPAAFDQGAVETAIRFVSAHFARLAGSRENVLVLDSGGGVYVMIPPSATRPLLDAFDAGTPGRSAVVRELADQMNDWIADVEQEMHRTLPETRGVIKFDTVNHKNRAFKAPLSLHKTYDAVVRPLDPGAPDYTALHPDDVDADDVAAAREWAASFAADEYADAAPSIADELLDQHPTEWADERITSDGRLFSGDADLSGGPNVDTSDVDLDEETHRDAEQDVGVVTRYAALVAAVNALDGREVADRTIVSAWRDESGELRMFYPTWDPTCNGRANIAGSGGWKDTASGDGGGPVKMALIAAENVPRGQDATGRDFFRGVRLLRERFGFDLPICVPAAGSPRSDSSEYDQTPGWALRQAAVAFGLIYRREFEKREADNGSTYAALPDTVYNATLDRLTEAGVDHGRSMIGDGRCAKSYLRRKEEENGKTDDADETVAELLSAL